MPIENDNMTTLLEQALPLEQEAYNQMLLDLREQDPLLPHLLDQAVQRYKKGHFDTGARVKNYTIERLLGRGGMGVVYKATAPDTEQAVAIKILSSPVDDGVERFFMEARIASALQHPHIYEVYESGVWYTHPYLVMAYYHGPSLYDVIGYDPVPVEEALEWTRQVADGLHLAHTHGIVHRDIKPSNILITGGNQAKIVDFGIAKVADQALTKTGELLGSPDYMSPEQLQGLPVGPAADVWSLGIVLYELLTEVRPYQGATPYAVYAQIQRTPLARPATIRPLPPALDALIMDAIQPDLATRIPTMEAFLDRLTQVINQV